MNYKDMLHRELIFLDENSNNREELFESISHKLMDLGYVKKFISGGFKFKRR